MRRGWFWSKAIHWVRNATWCRTQDSCFTGQVSACNVFTQQILKTVKVRGVVCSYLGKLLVGERQRKLMYTSSEKSLDRFTLEKHQLELVQSL